MCECKCTVAAMLGTDLSMNWCAYTDTTNVVDAQVGNGEIIFTRKSNYPN